MSHGLASLAATGLVALALNGCVIVADGGRGSSSGTEQTAWRRPARPSATASDRPTACGGERQSPQQIFAGARDGVAVVLTPEGQGSAFVVRHETGRTLLLTNSHVVGTNGQVQLVWSDGRRDQAAVVADAGAQGPSTDLALLAASGTVGRPLPIASAPPEVGQSVVVIGAPMGLDYSLSSGVVSQVRNGGDFVQTDAAINPGNSGGPLLDERGCVVGMVTFKRGDSEGLNFAISTALIRPFLAGTAIANQPAPAAAPAEGYGIGSGPEANGLSCFFQSYRKPQGESISCSISSRRNSNGHSVYDVAWGDGYRSSYVFWSDGAVEILSKGGDGQLDRHIGRFQQHRDGVAISSNEGSITFLPNLEPSLN
jgi:hypothetical protein